MPAAGAAPGTPARGCGCALFATSPAVFNFDASGVVDGEDATSALQVRWDFEDDGVFDTSFSTTKTTSHDYAQGYAVTVSQEVANTYLYSTASSVELRLKNRCRADASKCAHAAFSTSRVALPVAGPVSRMMSL